MLTSMKIQSIPYAVCSIFLIGLMPPSGLHAASPCNATTVAPLQKADEAYAANCVGANGTVLAPAGFPATRQAIEAAGLRVLEIETSEIRKADGSLTCMSLLL